MRWYMLGFGVVIWAFVSATGEYRPAAATAQDKDKQDALIKRGDYLVNKVSRCGDCHTPRKDNGKLDTSKHLQGATTWFAPLPNIKFKKWDKTVPDITKGGMASKWSEEKLITFFSTGVQVNMPMPAYNLTLEDAQAVTAYLRSLPGTKKGAAKKE
jgi:mono/diheme cytochrome c family protein